MYGSQPPLLYLGRVVRRVRGDNIEEIQKLLPSSCIRFREPAPTLPAGLSRLALS
jgi:hypothetical protein